MPCPSKKREFLFMSPSFPFLTVVQGRFLVVKGRKTHTFEVTPIPFLSPHHDPHCAPLGNKDWLNHARDLVDKGYGTRHVVQHLC